jgi:transposase-like protein
MIAQQGVYGVVSQMSQNHGVSRQTLYTWKAKGLAAMQEALRPKEQRAEIALQQERAILTLLVEGHASYRGIQSCLQELLGNHVSLGTIVSLVQEAGKRAREWMSRQKSGAADCALALDEQYSSKRGEGYLNVVDVHSSAVWASVPPVPVDAESWTLLLWYLQEQGVIWQRAVTDGGQAMQEALRSIGAASKQQRDVWHVLHLGSQVQGRVDRHLSKLQDHLPTIQRQAQRVAQGKKALGVNPRTDVQAHLAQIKQAEYIASGLGYLCAQLRRLLEVVVLGETSNQGILDRQSRQDELETIVQLLVQLEHDAPAALTREIQTLHKHVRLALPHLLLFVPELDHIQYQVARELGEEALYLIGWAWQRRRILGPRRTELVKGFPSCWQPLVEQLLQAWDRTVRASSVVENWHSILRPHLAVHRCLTASMLALLAVWHNHRIAPRGSHVGQSPLQRSGLQEQPPDWLTALGYPPAFAIRPPAQVTFEQEVLAA